MKNTLKTGVSVSKQSAWRQEMKAILIKNGGKIRPILGNASASFWRNTSSSASDSFIRIALKEIQAEVCIEQKEISYALFITQMPVEHIDSESFRAGFPNHVHTVKHFPGKIPDYWCYECRGFLKYRHCRHVDAVKLFIQHESETKLEA